MRRGLAPSVTYSSTGCLVHTPTLLGPCAHLQTGIRTQEDDAIIARSGSRQDMTPIWPEPPDDHDTRVTKKTAYTRAQEWLVGGRGYR